PETITRRDRRTPNAAASASTTAALALPSTAGAATATSRAGPPGPSHRPPTAVRRAPGRTRTANRTNPSLPVTRAPPCPKASQDAHDGSVGGPRRCPGPKHTTRPGETRHTPGQTHHTPGPNAPHARRNTPHTGAKCTTRPAKRAARRTKRATRRGWVRCGLGLLGRGSRRRLRRNTRGRARRRTPATRPAPRR